ncbi:MAG: single-stranded-DNA-specific exonuclease RecJ [Patescibacteria group bacterium]|jgi:single-stranded-DNA-specific exonuclease
MKKWIIAEKKSDDVIEQILINRKITAGEKQLFLNPSYNIDLHNPRLLSDAPEAAKRIIDAIEKKEKIGIFADYDADGIPGGVLLYEFLNKIGATDVFWHVPERSDGYGLSNDTIDLFIQENVNLIITVDAGITAKVEVAYAKKNNIEVIITDHHEIQKDKLPKDCLIINPKLSSKYPFKDLCGTGVVFKLCQLISEMVPDKINPDQMKWFLDLVAISTICDIVPLLGENRVLTKFGLIVLRKTKRIGLKSLYKISAIDPEKIDPYVVGFQIGPRINAGGRLKNSKAAFKLLIEKDEIIADNLAQELNKINIERQEVLSEAILKAISKIEKQDLSKNKILMISDETWPAGIVGLIAGKIVEKYGRPAIVLGKDEENLVGSARSIDGFHLIEDLSEVADMMIRFGGHSKAAGLTFKESDFDNIYAKILKIAEEKLSNEDLVPSIHIDLVLKPIDVNIELTDQLKFLEPYGLGNYKPIFAMENVVISDAKTISENKHLVLKLASKEGGILETFNSIGFNMGELNFKSGEIIDVAFYLEQDEWAKKNGRMSVQLKLVDIKKSGEEIK